jgi:hypothetical protein
MEEKVLSVTREKHLDHMVRVVPFIVTAYAIQCYFILQLGSQEFGSNGLMFLGGMLTCMISGFIAYDLTHVVKFHEEAIDISVKWLGYHRTIAYQDIIKVEVLDPGQSFSTMKIETKEGKKIGIYFVDDADKIKAWLEQKRFPEFKAAA